MGFLDSLSAAVGAERPWSEPVPVSVNGDLFEVVFQQADGGVWAECTAKHPARSGVAIDQRFGYDVHGVCFEVAPVTGRVVDGDEKLELPAEKWAELFGVLSGSEVNQIASAVWAVNEFDPQQRVAQLKKASSGKSGRKRG